MKTTRICRIIKFMMLLLITVATAFAIQDPKPVYAETVSVNATTLSNRDQSATITNTDRQTAYVLILEHMNSIKAMYDLSQAASERMDAVFYQANVYIANTDMTVGQLSSYVGEVKSELSASVGDAAIASSTSKFLFLCNEVPVSNAKYGESTTLVLSLINLGVENVTDVVITPTVSTKASEWPFVIQTASDARMITSLPAASSVEESYQKRQDVSWDFVVSPDAMTGTYALTFHVQYYRNGNIEETDLKTYIDITGAPGNGSLSDVTDTEGNVSTPRIIVTGFTTDPGEVYAGDTFNLTISVQNTSDDTTISNIQFDLKAAQEGKDDETTYEAFLPTSGSATVYVDSIAPGETTDINIEMTARSDLAQKPYVVTVSAAYEDEENNPYTASTNVSIPVKQIARVDTGEAEVLPESVAVGSSANIMFSIYNMGKTTLYNVQVAFAGDTVSGGSTFIGKIEPGATGSVDAMVDGIAETMDDGMITAVITYEDEAGNVSTLEKEITLWVYLEDYGAYDDMEYMDEEMMMEEEPQGLSIAAVIGIIVAGVVVVVVVVLLIVRSKKKRKAALAAELRDLEEIDNDDTTNV